MHSPQAEATVLGTLLLHADLWPQVSGSLVAGDFAVADYADIFAAMQALVAAGKTPESVAVCEVLRARGTLLQIGPERVMELASDFSSQTSFENSVAIVREMADRRRIVDACRSVADSKASSSQMAAALDSALQDARKNREQPRHIGEVLGLAEEHLRQAMEIRAAGGIIGAPFGLPGIDQRIGGACAGRLYVVAGRPGVGKTGLLNQFAFHAADHGFGGAIFSIEMTISELLIRAAAASTQRNVSRMFRGVKEDCDAAFGALANVAGLPLWLNESLDDVDSIIGAIAMLKRRHNIRWAIVDHIGLVHDQASNRVELLDQVTRKLKKAAKKYDVAIIAASQLNRGVEKDARRPQLSDLRESGGIEQNADVCVFLHADGEAMDGDQKVAIGVLKNRNGPKGWCSETFRFNGKTQRFIEIAPLMSAPRYEGNQGVAI